MPDTTGESSQTTVSAPGGSPARPSAPGTATGTPPKQTTTPANAAPTRTAKATKPASNEAQQRRAPAGPSGQPTFQDTEMELDELLAEHERGRSAGGNRTDDDTTKGTTTPEAARAATPAPGASNRQTQTQNPSTADPDPLLQKAEVRLPVDEATAAAQAAGVVIAPPEAPSAQDDVSEENAAQFNAWLTELEKVSKGAADKIRRQQKQIATFKAAQPEQFKLEPTDSHPLAHVSDERALDAEHRHWITVRDECRRLMREGTFDGGEIKLANGQPHKFSTEKQIRDSLAFAEAVVDAVPGWRQRLADRAKDAPWEKADRLAPGIYTPGSEPHRLAMGVLSAVPEFKAKLPDWDVKLAHMARSAQMDEDEKATASHPHGRARWVRLELDAQGRAVMPAPKEPAVVNTKPVSQQAPVHSPSLTRPAVAKATTEADADAHLNKAEDALTRGDRLSAEEELEAGLRNWARAGRKAA